MNFQDQTQAWVSIQKCPKILKYLTNMFISLKWLMMSSFQIEYLSEHEQWTCMEYTSTDFMTSLIKDFNQVGFSLTREPRKIVDCIYILSPHTVD